MAFDFSFTEEHEELRATVRAFLEERSDEKAVREQMATERGYDPEVWSQLAEQLGLAGLIIPEEHGGAGFGYVELLIAMEEMGRALLCAPYLGTAVFSANALLHCADDATQKDLLAGIASGSKPRSVAMCSRTAVSSERSCMNARTVERSSSCSSVKLKSRAIGSLRRGARWRAA